MSHVADSPINRLFDRFFGAFYPYPANKSALRCGRDHPPSGIRETWLAPNVHLATVLLPHAPRSTPDQRGQDMRRPSPAGYYLTPTPELAKTERDPISTSGSSIFQYVTEPGDSFGQIKHLPEFAQAVRHGLPGTLESRG